MKCPEEGDYWTCDEVAECLPVPPEVGRKLWRLMEDAERPKPLGGDGSNGTTEEPIVGGDYDNYLSAVWDKLDESEQKAIIEAFK